MIKNVILDFLVSDAYKNVFVKMEPTVTSNPELVSVKLAGTEPTGKFGNRLTLYESLRNDEK